MKKIITSTYICIAALIAININDAKAEQPLDVVAVYYPHWHQYPKGDEWFGPTWNEGEWTYVKTMKSRFPGHKVYKPLPGYLNGKNPDDVATEIDLAAGNGITVFLYDYYWYNGEKTQEEAIEQGFLKAKNRDRMKFALMWCYHERFNQFRPAYGVKKRTPLMSLAHTPEEFLGLIDYSIANYFNKPEYWRKDGKLFFSIYNAMYLFEKWGKDAAKVKNAFAEARRRVRVAGLGELHINAQNVRPTQLAEFEALGFDSFTDYGFGCWRVPNYGRRFNAGERLFGFEEIDGVLQKHWADMRKGNKPYIPIVPSGWDSTPRCRNDVAFPWKGECWYPYCGTYTNVVPELFEKYLRDAKAAALSDPKKPGAVYINAWNEYTEGCSLLPSVREGDLMLRCVGRVFGREPSDKITSCTMKHWWDPKAGNGKAFAVDAPTYENLKYGSHMRQSLDVWLPKAEAKMPVLINIHGGGWSDGDRLGGISWMWPKCRDRGIALVSISYRMVHDANDAGIKPPVKVCLDDAVAAIEFVKANADKWNIDVKRIALTGGSAGACSSLYAALQNDCELGIKVVRVDSPQTSLDPKEMKEWIPNSSYGSHAFGYRGFNDWLAHREECLPLVEKYSPAALLRKCTPSKAPVFFYTCPALPKAGELPKDPTHAAMFCVKFEEICKARGIKCCRNVGDAALDELKK